MIILDENIPESQWQLLRSWRIRPHLIGAAGVVFILLGFGQLLFFLGADEAGLIEVGNALGHGLLLVLAVVVGLVFLFLAVVLFLLTGS